MTYADTTTHADADSQWTMPWALKSQQDPEVYKAIFAQPIPEEHARLQINAVDKNSFPSHMSAILVI